MTSHATSITPVPASEPGALDGFRIDCESCGPVAETLGLHVVQHTAPQVHEQGGQVMSDNTNELLPHLMPESWEPPPPPKPGRPPNPLFTLARQHPGRWVQAPTDAKVERVRASCSQYKTRRGERWQVRTGTSNGTKTFWIRFGGAS